MKRWLAQFCVRHSILPRHPRFVAFIRDQLFIPVRTREPASYGLAGYFDLGTWNADQRAVNRFRAWWKEVSDE